MMEVNKTRLMASAESSETEAALRDCVIKATFSQADDPLYFGTLASCVRAILEEAETSFILADEGENPDTGKIEPYLDFVDVGRYLGNYEGTMKLVILHQDGPTVMVEIEVLVLQND